MKYTADRILYLGAPSVVRLSKNAPAADVMFETGQNTGNLLIGDAIRRHLTTGTLRSVDDLLRGSERARTLPRFANMERLDRAQIETDFDVIVIGAANFLNSKFDFTAWANFLESVRLPCVIIGVGAQAPDYSHRITVPDGTRRMMEIVAERSVSLGARGHYSADTLRRMGITNVRVIGCPSMYWSCEPVLRLTRRPAHDGIVVTVNGSANVVEHAVDVDAARSVEASIARLSFDHGYPYVLQNETELMDILVDAPGAFEPSLIDALQHRYGLHDVSPDRFVQFVRRNMKVFTDVSDWLCAVQASEFVLGTRFHGCLIGLLGGVPSVMFTHDARTREMCELLSVPQVDVRDARGIDVRSLYESVDIDALEAAYLPLYRNYVEFLDENRLEHRLRL